MADYVVIDKEQLEADLTTVSDSIRGLIESEEKLEFPQGMKEAIESYSLDEPLETQDALIEQIKTALQGKAGGGEDYLKYIQTLSSLFESVSFPENTKLVMELPRLKSLNGNAFLYGATGIIEIKLIGELEGLYSCSSMFRSPSIQVVDIEDFNVQYGNIGMMFAYAANLISIKGELDLSTVTNINNTFIGCSKLENLTLKPLCFSRNLSFANSSLLSAESIQSIINCLADLTGQETQTLTLHADVKAKLTETQISTITSKNWTLA